MNRRRRGIAPGSIVPAGLPHQQRVYCLPAMNRWAKFGRPCGTQEVPGCGSPSSSTTASIGWRTCWEIPGGSFAGIAGTGCRGPEMGRYRIGGGVRPEGPRGFGRGRQSPEGDVPFICRSAPRGRQSPLLSPRWGSSLLEGPGSGASRPRLVRLRACHGQRGGSPPQAYALRPVTDCNCVAVRRGGEQQEASDQSAG